MGGEREEPPELSPLGVLPQLGVGVEEVKPSVGTAGGSNSQAASRLGLHRAK